MEDKLKRIRFDHLDDREIVLSALDVVLNFIKTQELILVGGMAIDMNLRLTGESYLYEDDELPDYDFYSPNNTAHAYQLGSELCKKGFRDVDVITAIHTTTMKVRVSGHVVADITYMPPILFEKIPTQIYKNIKIVHPYMIMMDQFTSLSGPFENPPGEVVLERWTKDQKRFNMLLTYYPFGVSELSSDTPIPPSSSTIIKDVKGGVGVSKLNFSSPVIKGGWAALAEICELHGLKNIKIPDNAPEVYYMWDQDEFCKLSSKYQKYNETFSYFPYFIVLGNTKNEVYDIWGFRLTVYPDDHKSSTKLSIFGLAWYFMYKHIFHSDKDAMSALDIIFNKLVPNIKDTKKLFSVETPPGNKSWKHSTLYSVASIENWQRVKDWKPQPINFEKAGDCNQSRIFDPTSSPLFQIDGQPTKHFHQPIVEDLSLLTLKKSTS
jgi:hypothetical protein